MVLAKYSARPWRMRSIRHSGRPQPPSPMPQGCCLPPFLPFPQVLSPGYACAQEHGLGDPGALSKATPIVICVIMWLKSSSPSALRGVGVGGGGVSHSRCATSTYCTTMNQCRMLVSSLSFSFPPSFLTRPPPRGPPTHPTPNRADLDLGPASLPSWGKNLEGK